jgi:Flp pilus assembly pilin Flp
VLNLRRMVANQDGVTLVEYALLLSLIAVIIVAAAQSFGTALQGMYAKIASTLQAA